MEQQNDKPLIIASLIGLRIYAEHLAATDLTLNQEKIGQIRFLSGVMASYHCVEGYDSDADMRIQSRYLEPLDELLAGKPMQEPDFNEAHMKAVIKGLDYYREELELENEPVYDPDIKLCTELAGEMKMGLAQEESQEWGQTMQL